MKQEEAADALSLTQLAANMEDSTSKHPVTPGQVLPARELYADTLLEMKQNGKAFQTYKEVLQKSPNRFNSLHGAGVAAERSGDIKNALFYYKQMVTIADAESNRSELKAARLFINNHR